MTPATPPRVLLVDDNVAILQRAAATLASACLVVGTLTDAAALPEAVAALRPDVLVLDLSIGGVSGIEVAARLRAAGSTIPIVFLSVHDDEQLMRAALAKGALGFVVKPRLTTDLPIAVQEAHAGRPYMSRP